MVVVFPTLSLKGDPHLLHSPADTERMRARLLSWISLFHSPKTEELRVRNVRGLLPGPAAGESRRLRTQAS